MARNSRFAVQLRALRAQAGNPTQQSIGHAIHRTHSVVGYALRGVNVPSWDTSVAIINVVGGDPAEFRAAWEASRTVPERRLQRPDVPLVAGLRELLVRSERLADDTREFLGRITPDSVTPALPPGRLAEYRVSGAGGRDVSVWHANAGCTQSGIVHDGAQFLEWVLEHELEAHGNGP